jgi:hypothetical protein
MAKPGDANSHNTKKDKAAPPKSGNMRLAAQNRKILGKHYANKYRTGRG